MTAPGGRSAGDVPPAAALAALALAVFLASPVRPLTDSHFTILLSENLVRHGSFALDRYFVRPLDPLKYPRLRPNGYPAQIREANGHLYYFFPAGSSILSVPFVAVMNRFGLSAIGPDRAYDKEGERRMQGIVAAILMAGLAAVLYATARLFLPAAWSVDATVAAVLGTQVWSTASRVLWSVTWQMVLVALALLLLAAHEARGRPLPPVTLATILSWAYFVRPTSALFVVAVSLYMLAYHRPLLVRFAGAGTAWLAAFVAYSSLLFGTPLPGYYESGRLAADGFGTHLAGNLVSPSRGLLVFSPIVMLVFAWTARGRRRLPAPRLVWPALLAIVGHLLAVSAFPDWTGGHSYGPRLTADLVPWLFLLGVLGLAAVAQEAAGSRRAQLALAGALSVWGIFVHGRGALAQETWAWNGDPTLDANSSRRVWDWSYPQFLAGLVARPGPLDYAPIGLGTRVEGRDEASDRYLADGWGRAGEEGRWTTARRAVVAFALDAPRAAMLRMRIRPFLGEGPVLARQRVTVELNGEPLREIVLTDPEPAEVSIPIPAGHLAERNVLVLQFPDARSPADLGQGSRKSPRAIALEWLQLDPAED